MWWCDVIHQVQVPVASVDLVSDYNDEQYAIGGAAAAADVAPHHQFSIADASRAATHQVTFSDALSLHVLTTLITDQGGSCFMTSSVLTNTDVWSLIGWTAA